MASADLQKASPSSVQADRDQSAEPATVTKSNHAKMPEAYIDDFNTMCNIVEDNGFRLRMASPKLRDNETIVTTAVSNNGAALHFASARLQDDLEIVRQAVLQSGTALSAASERLRANPEIVSIAVEQNGDALRFADPKLQANPNLALRAASTNPEIIRYLPRELVGDSNFFTAVVRNNINAHQHFVDRLGSEPQELKAVKESMVRAFDELRIDHPERFDRSDEIIKNRYQLENHTLRQRLEQELGPEYFKVGHEDARPVCIIAHARADDTGTFRQVNGGIDNIDRLTRGYQVRYYEADSVSELADAISRGSALGQSPADLLVLSGHGTRYAIRLGPGPGVNQEFNVDHAEKLSSTANAIKPGGKVVLNACSTGETVNYGNSNLAKTCSAIWPQATIYAPGGVSLSAMRLGEKGEFIDPGYHLNYTSIPPKTVVLPPSKKPTSNSSVVID